MDILKHFYALVKQIPEGNVSTYGAIAEALGDKKAARAVGKMLHHNIHAPAVPCHRVVMSDGGIGGFATGIEKKRRILRGEGVHIEKGSVVDFENIRFDEFATTYPLLKLREEQKELAGKVILEDMFGSTGIIAGFDVAYIEDVKRDHQIAIGALTKWDMEKDTIVDVKIGMTEVRFPYIPTYLSYRELPVLADLLREDRDFDLLMVDGNGILHPLGIGIASHIGVVMDIPTIGIAKGLLYGDQRSTGESGLKEVRIDGRTAGYSLLSTKKVKRPIFISPGHRIAPKTALALVKKLCKFKKPEPVRRAHMEATMARRNILDKPLFRTHALFRAHPVPLAKLRLGKSDVPSGTSRPPQKAPKKIWMKTVPHDKKEKKRPKTTFLEKADQKKREKQLTQLAKKDNET